MKETRPRRRLFRTWEIVLWLLVLAVILYFLLAYFGYDLVDVTEDSRILEDPHR